MSPLALLPREILVEIALSLPEPQDVKHFSSTCRALRKALGQSNQLLWWHVWRKMYWMPDDSTSKFTNAIDYWQRVTDVLIPDQNEPQTCFDCFIQAANETLYKVQYEDQFYRALCHSCLDKNFWIVDTIASCYQNIDPPPELHASVNSDIYSVLKYTGTIQESKYPGKWIHKNDAIAFAKTVLPPEKTSDKGIFMQRWVSNWHDLNRRSSWRFRHEAVKGTGKEHLYSLEFHLGVGSIVYAMIEGVIEVYSAEYKPLHVIKSPRDYRRTLEADAVSEVWLGGSYEDKMNPDLFLRFSDPEYVASTPGTNNMSIDITHFSAIEYEACIREQRSPFGLSALCREILVRYFGPPCESELELNLQISSNPFSRVLKSWYRDLFLNRYRVKIDWCKLQPPTNQFFFRCPFCGTFPGSEENKELSNMVDMSKKEELFVGHIFGQHHAKFRDPWGDRDVRSPPGIYERVGGGEFVKVDCFLSMWSEPSPPA
ncbi:hypothetical protein TWF730_008725 [Orbilia blumenaviensis]|uniref:F-box domain-containing protein n=1 Tax=Orbilia blumenaviensis TaxID=1796055 RepID=A0AAV9V3I7_9PEZI